MVFRSNEPHEVRMCNKTLGMIKCKLHEKKQIPLEKIKIDRRGKQLSLDGVRIAYFDESDNIKYEGAAVDVKQEVDTFMGEWRRKREQ